MHPHDEPCGARAQRKIVLAEIEKLRDAKIIGKSEECRISCNFSGDEWWPQMQPSQFAEFCIVSQCCFTFGGGKDFTVIAEKSPLPACPRCYLRAPSCEDEDTGLCRRCRAVMGDFTDYAPSGGEK